MRTISITNQKGGCGKTTTAINLAAALATNNKKVLIIDLDPQAHATLGLNIKADLNIYNVLSKMTKEKAQLKDIIKNIGQNLDIAPSGIVLSTLEQELSGEIGRESRLWDILQGFKNDYDYILIDCPPNLGILTINAIRASSEIIIPVEASRFSLEGLSQLTDIINLVKERLSHKVQEQVLVVNFDSRLQHSFKMMARIKSTFSKKLLKTIVHVNVKLKEAQNQGTHVFGHDKYCRGAKDYFSLARELITQETAKPGMAAEEVAKPKPATAKKEVVAKVKAPAPAANTAEMSSEQIAEQMIEAIRKEVPKFSETILSVYAPDAREVFLAGDFNQWEVSEETRMTQHNGTWVKTIKLAPGRYRYRFVIDGKWVEDPSNPEKELNPYGQMDSLVEINPW
ncbi:MAG: hypothetical protein DRP74_04590 [Candidatus Omnitrophota bacterium]|nr:MAG: hypothetical protein DRP74_04590 [Candidatus Omnitrophota bacterium]